MTSTPNKGYPLQQTGTNSGTWGVVANQIFSTIDSNLGGTLSLSVAGNSNVVLTANQAQNLIYNFTGVLTGNITVTFPNAGGFYFINNQTTGAFTLTIKATGCTGTVSVPQGTQVSTYVDAVGEVLGAIGTDYVFSLGTIGGTANALTCSTTFPSNFSLNNGTLITFTPTADNTGSSTLTINGGSTITLQKVGATGLINLQSGDLFEGVPNIAQYNGTNWVVLNIVYAATPTQISSGFSLSFANWLETIIATSAFVITVPQVSATLTYYFNCSVQAGGGAVTWTPYSTDVIWVNGFALPAGGSYVQPKGSTAEMTTDANGNIYLAVSNANLSSLYTSAQYGYTAAAGTNTNQLATTAFVSGGLLNNVQVFTSNGTYSPTTGTSNAVICCQGGGGGGGGGGTAGGAGTAGNATSVGSLCVAEGGGAGQGSSTSTGGSGTAGGSAPGGTGTIKLQGSGGQGGGAEVGTIGIAGGAGGSGIFGTGAGYGSPGSGGVGGGTNTGGGGGGGGGGGSAPSGGGGGGGALSIAYASGINTTYTVTIGAAAAGGTGGGTGATNGGPGGSGIAIIFEYR